LAHPLIVNIQRFSIHDGAGIRTTVFFKGCPLRCAWCHNPESQSFEPEQQYYPERCVRCGRCAEGCPAGARETVGKGFSASALCALLERDKAFYDGSGGGVTLSGGEPMAQDGAYLLEVAKRLTQRGVRVAIDTCGYAPYERFLAVLPYVDTFLYDIKAVDSALHERYTGAANGLILANARRLSDEGARINVRVPVIPGVNIPGSAIAEPKRDDSERDNSERDDAETAGSEMGRIIRFVRESVRTGQINLLPYHRLGRDKSARLGGRRGASLAEPTPEAMEAVLSAWQEAGFENVLIGG